MPSTLGKIQEALEEAHDRSKRKGKWSTVPEVKRYGKAASLVSLRKLVKDGAASEKKKGQVPLKLFKPTRAGGGGAGSTLGVPGYRSPDPYDNPRGSPDPYNNWDKPGDRSAKNTGDVVGAGITTMLVGGMGSSIGGSGGGARAPYTISGPM
jgi:hypothetical protein